MGKEAVYRRLRGEVAFTIDEVALLSKKLGISIDQIIGNHLSNRVTFDMNLLNSPNTLDSYYEIINRYHSLLFLCTLVQVSSLSMDLPERANENSQFIGRNASRSENRKSA